MPEVINPKGRFFRDQLVVMAQIRGEVDRWEESKESCVKTRSLYAKGYSFFQNMRVIPPI
jgi:hypothetical protein